MYFFNKSYFMFVLCLFGNVAKIACLIKLMENEMNHIKFDHLRMMINIF